MDPNQHALNDLSDHSRITARESGLAACNYCGLLQSIEDRNYCERCKAYVSSRREYSLQRTWAFLIVGIIAYIPANIKPVMSTRSLTGSSDDTILSGIFALVSSGSYMVAFVIFLASICIPLTKFVVVGALALSVQFAWDMPEHRRHQLHMLIEFIGRWSMIDVFVVAVLAALIQLGAVLTIHPGVGINSFALSVVFTMFAASSLDPRLLWDNQLDYERPKQAG
ncbi:MAG: paraquat-inducible protein A [Granulosicoccus sp.]|nr:paraquat-inducible protein A [Granulosicoccus sp.]